MEYIHIWGLKKSHSFLCPGLLQEGDSWPQSRRGRVTFYRISQNHRTVRVWSSTSNPPKKQFITAVAQERVPLGLGISREEEPPLLWTAVPGFCSLMRKESFLMLVWNFPRCSLCKLPLVLSLDLRAQPHPLVSCPLDTMSSIFGMFSVVDGFILIYQPEPVRTSPSEEVTLIVLNLPSLHGD